MEFNLASNGVPLLIEQSVSAPNTYILLFSNFTVGSLVQLKTPTNIPFFQTNSGLYLGDKTPVLILINGQYKYFNITQEQAGNNPALVQPVDTPGNNPVSLTVLNRKTNNIYNIGSDILLNGINIVPGQNTNIEFNILTGTPNFIYSVAQCNTSNECSICSAVACPSNFSCNNGVCSANGTKSNTPSNTSLGLRYFKNNQTNILTISKSPVNNTYVFNFVPLNNVFPNYSNLGPVETWLNVEIPSGKTMEESVSYPLYLLSGTTKIYFTAGTITGNTTTYTGTTNKTNGILTFKPTKTGKWRQFIFSLNDFQELKIPGVVNTENILALWENPNMDGKDAVVPKKPSNGGNNGNNGTKPFYEQWWFWVIMIIVVILLIFVFIKVYS